MKTATEYEAKYPTAANIVRGMSAERRAEYRTALVSICEYLSRNSLKDSDTPAELAFLDSL